LYPGASPHAKKDAAAYPMICLMLPRTRNELLLYERRNGHISKWAILNWLQELSLL